MLQTISEKKWKASKQARVLATEFLFSHFISEVNISEVKIKIFSKDELNFFKNKRDTS